MPNQYLQQLQGYGGVPGVSPYQGANYGIPAIPGTDPNDGLFDDLLSEDLQGFGGQRAITNPALSNYSVGGTSVLDQGTGVPPPGAGTGGIDNSYLGRFEQKFGSLKNYGAAAQGVGALANAYTGFKNYGLAKDQFKLQKQYAAVNLANQAKLTNFAIESKIKSRASGAGRAPSAADIRRFSVKGTA